MAEPAGLWVAPIPECPVHGGRMKYRIGLDPAINGAEIAAAWACPGWDGEGCDHVVRIADAEWTYIGKSASFTAPLDSPNARIALGGEGAQP